MRFHRISQNARLPLPLHPAWHVHSPHRYEGDEYVITCGESLNIRKGDQFQVSLIKYSGGERQSEVVGAVKVQDLRASTSAVSFTEGKDRIIELIPTLDANSFLQCRLLLLKSR